MESDLVIKLILLGPIAVGKSSILSRYLGKSFEESTFSTIGQVFAPKTIEISGKSISTQIWDTNGQEKFKSITQSYLRGTTGALLVYDITDAESFEKIKTYWLPMLREFQENKDAIVMIIGNKSDMETDRQVDSELAIDFAKRQQAFFLETSAKDHHNITEAFQQLVEEICRQRFKRSSVSAASPSVATEVIDERKQGTSIKLNPEQHYSVLESRTTKKRKCC